MVGAGEDEGRRRPAGVGNGVKRAIKRDAMKGTSPLFCCIPEKPLV
jgi:hypothetical protein